MIDLLACAANKLARYADCSAVLEARLVICSAARVTHLANIIYSTVVVAAAGSSSNGRQFPPDRRRVPTLGWPRRDRNGQTDGQAEIEADLIGFFTLRARVVIIGAVIVAAPPEGV